MVLSPVNGVVLTAAALVASPALWLCLVEGNLELHDALLRFLIAVPLCWGGLNVLATWFLPDRSPETTGRNALPGPDASDQLAHTATGTDAS